MTDSRSHCYGWTKGFYLRLASVPAVSCRYPIAIYLLRLLYLLSLQITYLPGHRSQVQLAMYVAISLADLCLLSLLQLYQIPTYALLCYMAIYLVYTHRFVTMASYARGLSPCISGSGYMYHYSQIYGCSLGIAMYIVDQLQSVIVNPICVSGPPLAYIVYHPYHYGYNTYLQSAMATQPPLSAAQYYSTHIQVLSLQCLSCIHYNSLYKYYVAFMQSALSALPRNLQLHTENQPDHFQIDALLWASSELLPTH